MMRACKEVYEAVLFFKINFLEHKVVELLCISMYSKYALFLKTHRSFELEHTVRHSSKGGRFRKSQMRKFADVQNF
jgi:hypothetical protein